MKTKRIDNVNLQEVALDIISELLLFNIAVSVDIAFTVNGVCRLLNAVNWSAKTVDEKFYCYKMQLLIAMVESCEIEMYYGTDDYGSGVWYIYDENGVQYSVHDLGQYQEMTGIRPTIVDHAWSMIEIQPMGHDLLVDEELYDKLVRVSK